MTREKRKKERERERQTIDSLLEIEMQTSEAREREFSSAYTLEVVFMIIVHFERILLFFHIRMNLRCRCQQYHV